MGIYNGDNGYDNDGLGVKIVKYFFLVLLSICTLGIPIIIAVLKKKNNS